MSSSSDEGIKGSETPIPNAEPSVSAPGSMVKKKLDPEIGIDKKSFRNLVIASLFIPLVGWFVGLTNGFAGKKLAKQAWTLFAISTVAFFVLVAVLGGGSPSEDSKMIERVKSGELSEFPGKTVGHAVESFLGDPKWDVVFNEGAWYVDVSGKMTYMEKEVTAKIQFQLHAGGGFEINALELNDLPQNRLVLNALIGKMFGSQ